MNTQGSDFSPAIEKARSDDGILARLRRLSPIGMAKRYLLSALIVALATGLRLALGAWVGHGLPPYITFYPAMMAVVVFIGLGPGVLATGLMALITCYSILPPIGQFSIASPVDRLELVIFTGTNLLMCVIPGFNKRNREKSEAALRLSELEFRSLAEAMPQIVWATRPDGWNIYFNRQWVDYTGLTMEESYGHGWNSPFHPDDKQRAWDAWQRATQHNERYSLECRLRRADGVYRWWLIRGEPMRGSNGKILKWFGTCTDIEELKRAETALHETNALLEQRVAERTAALRESEGQFRALADSIPNLAWWANGDGYITWYNRRWYEYTGTTPEQMEGWGWQSVHDPNELPKVLERWQASIATGEPFDMTLPLLGADGVFRSFLTRVLPLKDAAGRVRQWFGTNTDVSELKRAEEQAKASLVEKEVLLKEIHHRVKNNLQVISSLISLQANGSKDVAVRQVLQDVTYRVRSMALVHEKLYQSADLAHIDFAEYTRGLLSYLWRAHGAIAAAVRMTLDLEPVSLPTDTAVTCGLILNELAVNALEHAFQGRADGEVTVSLHS